jgi:predicted transcriptional regulator
MNCYAPLVKREDYQKQAMNEFVGKYFDHSYPRMLAFFAKEQKMTEEEIAEILKLINSKK